MAMTAPFPLGMTNDVSPQNGSTLAPSMPSPFALPPTVQPSERRKVLRLSPERREALLKQLKEHYEEAKAGMQEAAAKRALRYKRYLADPSLRDGMQPWEDAVKLFLPLTRSTIESLHDEFTETILGTLDNVQIKGVGEEDKPKAERAEQFFRWALEEVNEIDDVVHDVIMDALLDSLGVLKVYPYRQPFEPWDEEQNLLKTIVQIDAVDIGTLGIPPDAKGLQYPYARYLWHQMWIYPELEWDSLKKRGFKLPGMDDLPPAASRDPDERERLEYERGDIAPESYQEGALEMVEAYEYFDITGNNDWEFIVANWCPNLAVMNTDTPDPTAQLARAMRLKDAVPQRMFTRPMWPFFPVTLWRQSRQLRGLNIPDRLESQQDTMNRLVEQMVHAGQISILPYYFYSMAITGDMPDLTQVKPGTGIPVDQLGAGGTGVVFPPRRSDNRHYLEQIQFMRGSAEEDSKVTAFTQGRTSQQPNAPRTLGGLALLLQQGTKAFRKQSRHLSRQLNMAFKMAFGIWQMRFEGNIEVPMPQTEALQKRLYEGQTTEGAMELVSIDADSLSGRFDVRLKVNPDAALERQTKLTIAEQLNPLLGNLWPRGQRMLWKDIWETLGLQGFDQIYPEYVADLYSMLKALDLQLKLAQMEQMLNQPPPGTMPSGQGEWVPPGGGAPTGGIGAGIMELLSPFAEGLAKGRGIGQQLFGGSATPGGEMAQAAGQAAPAPMVPTTGGA